jgi:PQQ-dependent catabolism-associated beta-propeller protein
MRIPAAFSLAALAVALAAPAHAKGTGMAFVTSEKDHTITVLDTRTLEVAGTIKTCKRPRHIQMLPGDEQFMVVCSDSGQADIVDLATRKSTGRISLGEDPEAFDLSPDGKTIYVSAEEDAELVMFDMKGKKIKSVKVGKEPEGVKASPDGKTVWVTSEVANMVHVYDTASGKVTHNVKAGKRPRRFALTPDGKELWVTNELSSDVTVLSTADYKVLATIPFKPQGMRADDVTPVGITMTRDGKTMYVSLGKANHVAEVDATSREVKKYMLVGKRAWNVTLNRDESRLYVVNGLSDDVTVIDRAAGKAIKSVPVGRVPYGLLIDD